MIWLPMWQGFFHIKKRIIVSTARPVARGHSRIISMVEFALNRVRNIAMKLQGPNSINLSVQKLCFEIIVLIANCCLVMTAKSRLPKLKI